MKDGWQEEKSRQEVPLTQMGIQKTQGMANNTERLNVVKAGGVE